MTAVTPRPEPVARLPKHRRRTVRPGHLPVTELLSDRPGASSPFGDDQVFPLPLAALGYRHPDTR